MSKKINVAILFGGKSAEHEVSLRSAYNVIDAIDRKKYNPILIGIDKSGRWLFNKQSQLLLNTENINNMKLNPKSNNVALVPQSQGNLTNLSNANFQQKIDVVFPILHGPFGEDGTVQGLLKLAGIPFVGSGVLGSAVGMDKDVMKRLLEQAKIPIGKYLVFRDDDRINYRAVTKKLGSPIFIKPANMGSSVGISKVKKESAFKKAIKDAFKYDNKIVIEEFIRGREIECAVLGNEKPQATLPGEILPTHEFYSYEAKYLDENGAKLVIPAKLPPAKIKEIQKMAIKVFQVLSCEGLSRVDFFLEPNGQLKVIEINTIPGFTSISMYPRLWGTMGINYTQLIDKLIQLAIKRFKKEEKLTSSR